jgi:phage pi2 protein 07
MKLPEGEFTHATFFSDEGQLIRAIYHEFEDENGDEKFHEIMINVDLEDPLYQKLLETFNLQQIKNMTNEEREIQKQNFLSLVQELAVENGMVYDPENANNDNKLRVDHIFELPEGEFGEEFLFNLKLRVFDMDEVMNSEDADLKKKLREAKTPLESLYIAGKFLYE